MAQEQGRGRESRGRESRGRESRGRESRGRDGDDRNGDVRRTGMSARRDRTARSWRIGAGSAQQGVGQGRRVYPRLAARQLRQELLARRRSLRTAAYLQMYQHRLEEGRNMVAQALDSISSSVGGIPPRAYDTRGNYRSARERADRQADRQRSLEHTDEERTDESGENDRSESDGHGSEEGESDDSEDSDDSDDAEDSDDADDAEDSDDADDAEDADDSKDADDRSPAGSWDVDRADSEDRAEQDDRLGARSPDRGQPVAGSGRAGQGRDEAQRRPTGSRQAALQSVLDRLVRMERGRPYEPRLGVVNRHLARMGHHDADDDELKRAFALWRRGGSNSR